MAKVLIAGESDLLRKGLESLVTSDPSLTLAGSLDDLSGLEQAVQETSPDVVLVVVEADTMGILQSFAANLGAAGARRAAPVILAPASPGLAAGEVLRSGIAALLPQDASGEEILAAVHAAAVGLVVVHPSLVELDHHRPRHLNVPAAPVSPLTPRELEVLAMLAEGLGNKEIAWRLKISEHTVKFHVTSIFTKLDVSSRTEAVSLGFRLGLILV